MNPVEQYEHDRDEQVRRNIGDAGLRCAAHEFTKHLVRTNYTKNFTWMGRPILQYPSDMFVMQELIWKIKPDVIIETGMAFGGTAVFYASVLEAIGKGVVVTVDIDPREENMAALVHGPLRGRISIIEGDSSTRRTKAFVVRSIREQLACNATVLACLDSNHTEDHVYKELCLYSPLVSVGSYLVVFDTAIEHHMTEQPADRPWGPGNNPMTAVARWLWEQRADQKFVRDLEVEKRALVTAAPHGWLKRIK
ncbi:MAG: cephalosporin hydroxylase family protein [Dehalococcoidia bacterium]|jgi:cephalosporin hydroxylase|nr:cephalosporin hydroxylase family protein [Dehalococcoidia bacterium]